MNDEAFGGTHKLTRKQYIKHAPDEPEKNWRTFYTDYELRGKRFRCPPHSQLRTLLKSRRIVPPIANHFPHLLIEWDEQELGVSRSDLNDRLKDGTPSIVTGRVYGTGDDGFLISVVNLQDGEESVVAQRIVDVLSEGPL